MLLAFDLWYLDALELWNISALLFRKAAALPVGDFRALGPWNSLAFFFLHSVTQPLLNLSAFFLGYILALLGPDVTANLVVVNLLADLFGHRVALLAINSLALATWNIPAFLLRNLRALSIRDHTTLLGGDVLTNLVLNSVTLCLGDNFTLGLGVSGAFLLHNRFTLVLKPCRA